MTGFSTDMYGKIETFCIYVGYSHINYNGENYSEQKVGGSEIAAIKLAEVFAKKFKVYICGHNIKGVYIYIYI